MEVDEEGVAVKRFAGILISIVAIFVIFKYTETNLTWSVISKARTDMLLLALFLHSLFWFFWALRLRTLTAFIKKTVSYNYALKTTIASTFLAAITPSSAGGEPLRVKMLGDKGIGVGSASAVVLAERLLDAIFFIIALPVFLFLSGFSTKVGLEVGIIFAAFLVVFILFLYKLIRKPENADRVLNRVFPGIKRFLGEEKAQRICKYIKKEIRMFSNAFVELTGNSFKQILVILLMTSAIWFSEFFVPSAILLAFNHDPYILFSLTSQLILVILSLAPVTPGASGIAEAGMFYLYSRFVSGYTIGVLVAVWRVITYFSNLIAGFIVTAILLKTSLANKQKHIGVAEKNKQRF